MVAIKSKSCLKRKSFLILTSIAIAVLSASISIAVLVHLQYIDSENPFLHGKFYGRIRIMKVAGEQLHWNPALNNFNLSSTILSKKLVQYYMSQSLLPLSNTILSVSVIRFSEDLFSQLVGAEDRGVIVEFRLITYGHLNETLSSFDLKDTLLLTLNLYPYMDLDLESLEIQSSPLIESRNYKSFEEYLASGETGIDLSIVELYGIKSPDEESGNITCPSIQSPDFGRVFPLGCTLTNYSVLGQVCTFSCDVNHTLIGSTSVTCMSTGHWSNTVPVCKARCLPLTRIPGVEVTPSTCTSVSSLAHFRCYFYCSGGHVLEGVPSRVCTVHGNWSGGAPLCKRTCAALSMPDHGEAWPLSCTTDAMQPAGTVCSFSCREGYTLAGSPSLFCDMDGSWNFPAPTCRRGCPPLLAPANGAIFPPICTKHTVINGRRFVVMEGVVCVHSCEENYRLDGSAQRLCAAGGVWTGVQAYCSRLCPYLVLPNLMFSTPHFCTFTKDLNKLAEGLKCRLSCPTNYKLSDNNVVASCTANGTWSDVPDTCVPTCPSLPLGINGEVLPTKCTGTSAPSKDTICSLNCNSGFSNFGPTSVQCLTGGKWSDSLGRCFKRCPVLTPPSNGFLHPRNCSVISVYEGSRCQYVCDNDYGLTGTEHRHCLTDGTWSGNAPTCGAEMQFSIRQTSANRDICLDINIVTGYVEKKPITDCSLNNRYQKWTILSGGLIRNVGTRKCLTAEQKHPGSFLYLRDCDLRNKKQVFVWGDANKVSVTLSDTSLELGYGYASIGKIELVETTKVPVPWYALTSQGIQSLYDIYTDKICYRLHVPFYSTVSPPECSMNQTVTNGTVCTFSCPPERKLKGDPIRACQSGKWNGSYPTCPSACQPLIPPTKGGGTVTPSCQSGLQDEGTVCRFNCTAVDHHLDGEGVAVCLAFGNWSIPTPKCTVLCKPLTPVQNGVLHPKNCITVGLKARETCNLRCQTPYESKGINSKTCFGNGSWTLGTFLCERGCRPSSVPTGGGGVVTCDSTTTLWKGDKCRYTCGTNSFRALATRISATGKLSLVAAPGPTGFINRTCLSTGLLDGTLPTCVSVCQPLTNASNGAIKPASCSSNVVIVGTECRLECQATYGVEGKPIATCRTNGVWEKEGFSCIRSTQFYITNQHETPPVCLSVDLSLTSTQINYGHALKTPMASCLSSDNSLWFWTSRNQLKHVKSSRCLTVLDRNAIISTPLVLQECSSSDLFQRWFCSASTDGLIKLQSAAFAIHTGETLSNQAVGYKRTMSRATNNRERWTGINAAGASASSTSTSLCNLFTNKCAPFPVPAHSTVSPSSCGGGNRVSPGIQCTVICKNGYVFNGALARTTSVTCTSSNLWDYGNATQPLECRRFCSSLSISSGVNAVGPCNGGKGFFKDLCTFSCTDTNQKLIGSAYSVCGLNGLWTDTSPSCSFTCPHQILPDHVSKPQVVYADPIDCEYEGGLYSSLITPSVVCNFACPARYRPAGSLSATCLSSGSFSISTPTCEIRASSSVYNPANCPDPPVHPDVEGKLLKSRICEVWPKETRLCAWYVCPSGYKNITGDFIHCEADTYTWGIPPSCKRVCQDHGYHCGETAVGEYCEISCFGGLAISHGKARIQCRADGSWSDQSPTCVHKRLFLIATIFGSGSTLEYYCLGLYDNLLIDSQIKVGKCKTVGALGNDVQWYWEGLHLLRHAKTGYCLAASNFIHGSRVILKECNSIDQLQQWECSSDANYPYQVGLKSNPDYILSAGQPVTGDNKDKLRIVHKSSLAAFTPPTTLANVQSYPEHTSWVWTDESIYFDVAYTLCSSRENSFQNCPPLKSVVPPGGIISPPKCVNGWVAIGDDCSFSCSKRYTYSPTSERVTNCLDEGIWSTINFDCVTACPVLTAPKYSTMSCTSRDVPLVKDQCTVQCESTFHLVGSGTRECQWDGRWSGTNARCTKNCVPLPNPGFSTVSPNTCIPPAAASGTPSASIIPDTVCLYTCSDQFKVVEPSGPAQSTTRTCYDNGTWSGNVVTCSRVCQPLTNPPNGQLLPLSCTSSTSIANSICRVICNRGFGAYGIPTRTCKNDGTWTNTVTDDLGPACRTSCPALPAVFNSDITCAFSDGAPSTNNVKGTICTITCRDGFGVSSGSTTIRTCQNNGTWSGSSPKCSKESQFVIFLQRTSTRSKEATVCLVSDSKDAVTKADEGACLDSTKYHRWAWHDVWQLKNAATGRCLSVQGLSVGQMLMTSACDKNNVRTRWSCNGAIKDGRSWFLRVANSDLFPDYGYKQSSTSWLMSVSSLDSETDEVHWFARDYIVHEFHTLSQSPPITVCARRPSGGICPPLSFPTNGYVHPAVCIGSETGIRAGTKCQFECNIGYRLNGGLHIVTCQTNGVWSGLMPKCSILCENVKPLLHGQVHPETCVEIDLNLDDEIEKEKNEDTHRLGVIEGDSCTFECFDGWLLVDGPSVVTCLASGTWNSLQPTCKRICPRFSEPINAVTVDSSCETEDKVQGQVCSFKCNQGYGVPRTVDDCGNGTTLADSVTGKWYCKRPEGEERNDATKGYNTEIHLSCSADGVWLGSEPKCFHLCNPLTNPENGFITPTACIEQSQVVGTTCLFSCNKRYMTNGFATNFTCIGGKWISTETVSEADFDISIFDHTYRMKPPSCNRYCSPLEISDENTSTVIPPVCVTGKVAVGIACIIECESDYVLKGNYKVVCQEDGSWDANMGTCIKKCLAIDAPSNGEVRPRVCTTASMGDGAVCTFVCADKYALDGSITAHCDGSGLWSFEPPTCKRRCLPLPRFYNGRASPVKSCFTEHIIKGESCTFVCEREFLLIGSPVLNCLSSGEWDAPPPTCNRICPAPTIEHGRVTCIVRGVEIFLTGSFNPLPTWGSSCSVECDKKYAPTQNTRFICRSNGRWFPPVPQCIATGVPMYILQLLGSIAVCLVENEKSRVVVQRKESECLQQKDYTSSAAWRWVGKFNIQNANSGRCIGIRTLADGEFIRTMPCDANDPLQQWDCSINNAFQLIIRGTDFAPTTYYRDMEEIVLERWSDSHSYYSTFDLVTLAHSSLCSRRPGGVCPPLTDIKGGTVEPSECKSTDIKAGLQCVYVCDEDGIVMNGLPYTLCMGNGIWSNPPPSCSGFCDPITDLPSGSYIEDLDCVFDPSPVGKVCVAKCKAGFDVSGDAGITCSKHKVWSPISFVCKKKCPALFGVLNGIVSPLPCRFGTCTINCQPGYVLSGAASHQIFCEDNGEWSEAIPKCLRDVQFRIISRSSSNQGEICITVPEVHTDPLIKAPCTPTEVHDGTQLFKWVDNSYQIVHPISGFCLSGDYGNWSSVLLAVCVPGENKQLWDCGATPGADDYSLHIKDIRHSRYYLDFGASIDVFSAAVTPPRLHRLAMESSYFWSSQWIAKHYFGQGTVCSMRDKHHCAVFPSISNGIVFPSSCHVPSGVVKGLICTVQCSKGYSTFGTDRSVCSVKGTWTEPYPLCTGIYQCSGLNVLTPALIVKPAVCSGKSVSEGVTCLFSCEQDHRLVGNNKIVCEQGGTWSGILPTCRPLCGPLRYVPNSEVAPLSCRGPNNPIGSSCSISCVQYFKLWGSETRSCRTDGSWSGVEVACVAFCPPAMPPASGNVYPDRCTKSENYEENACNFRCNKGFTLIGNKFVVCNHGRWNGDFPLCVPSALCPRVTAGKDGVLEAIYTNLVMGASIGVGTIVSFTCHERYKADGPERRICLRTGQWQRGLPRCLPICPPLLPPKHGRMVPLRCAWDYTDVGGSCFTRCDTGWSVKTSPLVKCRSGGEWSTDAPTCHGGTLKDEEQEHFIFHQLYRERQRHICLKLNVETMLVEISTECTFDDSVPSQYQWKWRDLDVGLIESVHMPGMCWGPVRFRTIIRLGVEKCDREYTSQHFHCADVTLRQYALHIGTENLWLGSADEDNLTDFNVNLVSSTKFHLLEWETLSVAAIRKSGGVDTNVNMSSDNSACSQMCGGEMKMNEGSISSPGYPLTYPRNTICQWKITVKERIIRLWISDIDIEPGRDGGNTFCNRDYLLVLEGNSSTFESSHVLATVCGRPSKTVGPISTYHGHLSITFKSDNKDSKRKGFLAQWLSEAFPPTMKDCYNVVGPGGGAVLNKTARLVGGSPEEITRVPWQAAIFGEDVGYEDNRALCGAVIIRDQYALTAAHCVEYITTYNELTSVVIGYGSSELWKLTRLAGQLRQSAANFTYLTDDSGATAHRLRDVYLHPNYGESMEHDIALIKLVSKISWSSTVIPACIPPADIVSPDLGWSGRLQLPQTYCKMAGWGRESDEGEAVGHLQAIEIPIVSDRQCLIASAQVFGRRIDINSTLCAAHFDGTRQGPCNGDDGGALACEWNGNMYVVGVAGQQLGSCARLNVPRYFARVSGHRIWLDSQIRRANLGLSSHLVDLTSTGIPQSVQNAIAQASREP